MREHNLSLPHIVELQSVQLYGATVDVRLEISADGSLTIIISAKDPNAAEIKLVSSKMWLGLTAGRYLSVDLEELEEHGANRFAMAATYTQGIIKHGLRETVLLVNEKVISSKCVIPVPGKPIEICREIAVLEKIVSAAGRIGANRQEKQYVYPPY